MRRLHGTVYGLRYNYIIWLHRTCYGCSIYWWEAAVKEQQLNTIQSLLAGWYQQFSNDTFTVGHGDNEGVQALGRAAAVAGPLESALHFSLRERHEHGRTEHPPQPRVQSVVFLITSYDFKDEYSITERTPSPSHEQPREHETTSGRDKTNDSSSQCI